MKSIFSLIILFFTINSCGKNPEVLNISMWVGNIPQEIYNDFTKETGIRINEIPMTSNEETYAKIKADPANYDIVAPSFDYAEIMLKNGLLATLDTSQIPNITNVDPFIRKQIQAFDKTGNHVMPFTYGPTLIMYDKSKVNTKITGFDIFADPMYKGKMSLLDCMREVMAPALMSLGYDMAETNEIALKKASDLIKVWKKNILRFDRESFHIAYANGEVDIIHGYPGTVIPNLTAEKRSNTVFVVPDYGVTWGDTLVVMANSPKKEAAMKFINFLQKPENYAKMINVIEGVNINTSAQEFITIKLPFSYHELQQKLTMLKALDDTTLEAQGRVWEEMKAQ